MARGDLPILSCRAVARHLYKGKRGDPSLTFGATKRRNSGRQKEGVRRDKRGVLDDKKGGRGHRGGSR